MKKIKITTNKGKIFDWFLNLWINYTLWFNIIEDNEEMATKIAADKVTKIKKYLNI